jgi:hypothetical protein
VNKDTRPVSRQLHPWVYFAIIGLVLCFVAAIWIGFAGSGYADYLLTIASLFVLGAMTLPFIAFGVWRANREKPGTDAGRVSFRQWAQGEFDIRPGHVKGATAAVEILLPLAAVAFGMLAFAILARLAA